MFCGSKKSHLAIFDYEATKIDEISFSKGDLFRVIAKVNDDWWKVHNLTEGFKGLVPNTYIGSIEANDWSFKDFSRRDAIQYLLSHYTEKGRFLVRTPESSTFSHQYSLSILDHNQQKGFFVKHFRIKQNADKKYHLTDDKFFNSLQELIRNYQSEGLMQEPAIKPPPPVYQEWEINRKEIVLGRELGSGNFGKVYYGVWRKKEVAVKTLKNNTMNKKTFLEEALIMQKIRHKNLVALYGVCTKDGPCFIVQEFMTNGSLLENLRKQPSIFKFEDLIYISKQVASGMAYLERKNFIHRDLAARNVLVGEKNIVKICDFGLAKVMEEDEYQPTSHGAFPVKWTAPEAIKQAIYTVKSDVWSYGILLTEIFSNGSAPYCGKSNQQVRDEVCDGNYRMKKPKNQDFLVPDNIYDIMRQCWNSQPVRRPTFEALLNFFEDYSSESEVQYQKYEDLQNSKRSCTIL